MLNNDYIFLIRVIVPGIIHMMIDSEHGEVPSIGSLDLVLLPCVTEAIHEICEFCILFSRVLQRVETIISTPEFLRICTNCKRVDIFTGRWAGPVLVRIAYKGEAI